MGFPLLPERASTVAGDVDLLFYTLLGLSLLFAVPVCGLIVYFGIRYRRGTRVDRGGDVSMNLKLELAWTIVPLLLSLGVFAWAARVYVDIFRPPADALEIQVVGKQWMWKTQHPTGQREINELHVPVGRPIKLLMTSQDVIHDFYVPAFRVRHDVIPGRYSTVWFQATKPGRYRLYCTEYCGTDHASMGGWVVAMEPADYERWLSTGNQSESLATSGEQLFQRLGCSGCHRPDGSGVGPSLVGVYGRPVPLADGSTVVADDQYIRDSILLPNSQVAAGYPAVMPTFQGQVGEDELLLLIAYIKSLDQGSAGGQR